MKLSRQLLKQLIGEEQNKLSEMCGDMEPSSHAPNGNGVAVQHPSPAGSGDMSIPDNDQFAGGDLAMSQLVHLMQNADSLKGLVSGDDELQGWVRGKLGKAGDYLNSITKFLEFEMLPDQTVALELRENKLEFSKNDLKQLIAEEILNEFQDQPHISGMDPQSAVGGSTEDTLRSSIMSALDSLKGGSVEEAIGQLQAALDASTGGAGLDK